MRNTNMSIVGRSYKKSQEPRMASQLLVPTSFKFSKQSASLV